MPGSESGKPAGYVYDPAHVLHDTGPHVETAARLESIMAGLESSGILPQLKAIQPRPATREEIELGHRGEYIERVGAYCRAGGGWWDVDTVMSPGSFEAAVHAAGAAVAAVAAVVRGDVRRAFALVRPPGHHATAGDAMGFCIFNNIAIAAAYALKRLNVPRVCIIDFDVHHGNGTQEAFAGNPDVLYVSLHQYPLYPGTGRPDDPTGDESVINIPLPSASGDAEYRLAFEQIVVPAARRFRPDLVMVSAGYDGHWTEELAGLRLTLDGYTDITRTIAALADELCRGRTVYCLEGGYNLPVLAAAVRATFEVWLGREVSPGPFGQSPSPAGPGDIRGRLEAIKQRHGL